MSVWIETWGHYPAERYKSNFNFAWDDGIKWLQYIRCFSATLSRRVWLSHDKKNMKRHKTPHLQHHHTSRSYQTVMWLVNLMLAHLSLLYTDLKWFLNIPRYLQLLHEPPKQLTNSRYQVSWPCSLWETPDLQQGDPGIIPLDWGSQVVIVVTHVPTVWGCVFKDVPSGKLT